MMLASIPLLIISTLTVVHSALALQPRKCYISGSFWGTDGRRAASKVVETLCQGGRDGNFSGTYHGGESRSVCVPLTGSNLVVEFKIEWRRHHLFSAKLTEAECIGGFRDEIYGCLQGGATEEWKSKWFFKYAFSWPRTVKC